MADLESNKETFNKIQSKTFSHSFYTRYVKKIRYQPCLVSKDKFRSSVGVFYFK